MKFRPARRQPSHRWRSQRAQASARHGGEATRNPEATAARLDLQKKKTRRMQRNNLAPFRSKTVLCVDFIRLCMKVFRFYPGGYFLRASRTGEYRTRRYGIESVAELAPSGESWSQKALRRIWSFREKLTPQSFEQSVRRRFRKWVKSTDGYRVTSNTSCRAIAQGGTNVLALYSSK